MRKYIIAVLFVLVSWSIGWVLGASIFSGPSAHAYGLLFAWWLTAYFAQLLSIERGHVLPAAAAAFIISISLSLMGIGLLYKDAAYASMTRVIVVATGHSMLVISPLVFNLILVRVVALPWIRTYIFRDSH